MKISRGKRPAQDRPTKGPRRFLVVFLVLLFVLLPLSVKAATII